MQANSIYENRLLNSTAQVGGDRPDQRHARISDDSISRGKHDILSARRPDFMEQLAVYKAEQLLSNPGAKRIYLPAENIAYVSSQDMEWAARIGKDLEDALLNIKNFFLDSIGGAEKDYIATDGEIKQTGSSPGFLESLINFMKDVGSALSLGIWRPDGENAQDGPVDTLSFCASKLKEAIGGDLLGGMAGSVIQMGEDLALAGWNLVEAVPDTLLGHVETGRIVVDTVFDNGQVVIDYITDVLPGGEAWMRVHASDITDGHFPILYNLMMPANMQPDARWTTIYNTPFRKSIETIGSLLADGVMIYMISQGVTTSDNRH